MAKNSLARRFYSVTAVRLFFVAIAGAVLHQNAVAETSKNTVFQSGEDGYHTYRIPAIVRAQNGHLLAFAEGRKNATSDHGDIDIVLKRSDDDGRTWSMMQLVQDEWDNPTAKVWIGNPAPVVDLMDTEHPGRIWLAFTRSNASAFVTFSDDHGATWSKRRDVSGKGRVPSWGWYATGPVHGIQLERGEHAGRLVIPCDHQIKADGSWGAHILYSDDHGATWQVGAVDTREAESPLHPNECVVAELVDGRIYVNARDQHGSDPATRAIAFSSDGGSTFDAPFRPEPEITTPVVQNSAIRFAASDRGDDRNVLVYSCPGHAKERRDLTILASFDEGDSWPAKRIVHHGPAAYSDLIKLNGKQIGVLYEAGAPLYDEIVFAVVDWADVANEW